MTTNAKPIHEIRIGAIKAAIWENGAVNGTRYNVTLSRLYKDGDNWKRTESFGRDDLLVLAKGKRYGFEFKYADAPGRSRSMHAAIHSLNLNHLWIVYPGKEAYTLEHNITVVPLSGIESLEAAHLRPKNRVLES